MVFTKDRHPHKWTLGEKKKLLDLYKKEANWELRSKKMCESFPHRRIKGFFSPATCHTEFNNLINSTPPTHRVVPPTNAGFSIKTLVDMWIEYFQKEIIKENEQQMELCMVDIRNCYALVERLVSGKPEMSDQQMVALLEEARAYDAKREPSTEIVVNAYMRCLMAQEEERRGTRENTSEISSPGSIPPTKNADVLPRGSETAFRSPSPSRSPIKTPIRRVAEAVREGISPIKTETPKRPGSAAPMLSPEMPPPDSVLTPEKKPSAEKMQWVKLSDHDQEMTRELGDYQESPLVELSKPPRRSGRENDNERNDSAKSERKVSKRSRVKPVDQTPVLQENIKEEIMDITPPASSPLPMPPTQRSRKSEKRSRKRKSDVIVKEELDSGAPSLKEEPIATADNQESICTMEIQTDISIITSFLAVSEKKERRPSTSRKTRGRAENNIDDEEQTFQLSTDGERRAVATQCSRLELDRDDKIVITWLDNERRYLPLVRLMDQEDVHEAGSEETSMEEDNDERRPKADSKKEITVIYDVEDWMATSLLLNSVFSPEYEVTPSKRTALRKDDKPKEEYINNKLILMNMWKAVQSHRHSSIFLHPVSEKEAPGYANAIKQRMDLQTLKKEIEAGTIVTPEQMKHRLMRMFANAVMYNQTDYEINLFAKEMARDTLAELSRLIAEGANKGPQLPSHHPRRSKVAEEHTARPTRSHVTEMVQVKSTGEEDRPLQTNSTSRKVFRRKRAVR